MPAAPAAPPPTAPAKPAPAPTQAPATSAPSAPSPAQAEPKPPPGSFEEQFKDAYAEIDAISAETESPPPPEPKEKPKAGEKVAPEAEKPEAKAGEKPVANPELRAAYEELKRKHAALEVEHTKLKTAPPPEDPEKKTLAERIAALAKEREELAAELKFSAFERSPEYKSKFLEPLERAFKAAYEDIAQLAITDAEGNASKATPEHLNALLRMSLPQAITQAKEWFGDASTEVLAMRRRIVELNEGRTAAIEQYRKEGLDRDKTRSEQVAKQTEELRGLWKKHVDEGIEGHPQLFKAADDDAKGKELLTKGFAMADAAFAGGNGMPPQELVRLHAAIRNKAGGYDYMVYRNRQLSARIKELEAKVQEFEQSQPGEGTGKRGDKDRPMTFEEEIDALAQE